MDWTTLTGELNLEALSEQIEQLFPNFSIDFSSLLGQILSGNAKEAFAGLAASLKNGVLAEMAGMKNLLLTLLIIGVLSALFTVVMQSFDNHQIADILLSARGSAVVAAVCLFECNVRHCATSFNPMPDGGEN